MSQLLPGAFAMPRPSVRAPAAVSGSNQFERRRVCKFGRGLTETIQDQIRQDRQCLNQRGASCCRRFVRVCSE